MGGGAAAQAARKAGTTVPRARFALPLLAPFFNNAYPPFRGLRAVRAWLVVLALALVVPGCAKPTEQGGSPSAVQQAIAAVAGDDDANQAGSIRGIVVSPSLAPIVAARVTLLRENISTRSDASGAFDFKDLALGSYLVAAEADGYKSRTVLTNAANGTVTELTITLEAAPVVEPYQETRELKGLVSCGLVAQTPAREARVDCAAADPNHRDSFEFAVGPGGKMLVAELVWSVDDNPSASSLRFLLETVGYGANDLELGNLTATAGYARIVVPTTVMDKYYSEGGAMRASVALVGDAAPSVALQTSFTVFETAFYVAAGADDFSVVKPASG